MKKATMLDIAKAAGVSKATVSRIINKKDANISEETRNKVLSIAKELNYIPNNIARSLTTKKSETIGIVVPDITNPFFSEMARAIEDSANTLGYNVIFCNSDNETEKEQKYIELLISRLADGVIFIAGGNSRESIEMLKHNGIPFVLVDRYIDGYRDCYGVYCDSKDGIKSGFEHLYSIGKRNIVFVTGPKELEISIQRMEGYREAVIKHGNFDDKYIFDGDFTIEGGIKVTEDILKSGIKFDAIMYSSDVMAYGGMKVLLRNGFKIPEDVSIVGFDNIQISQFIEPELTTIAQPIYDMGKEACRLLIDVINGVNVEKRQIYFKSELVIRGTT